MNDSFGTGALPSSFDVRDYTLLMKTNVRQIIPQEFCLKPILIKNQSIKPTCVAHALSSIIEYHNFQQSDKIQQFSTEFIYGCRKSDDYMGNGMYLKDGLKVIQKYGDVIKTLLPNNNNVAEAVKNVQKNATVLFEQAFPNRISAYYRIHNEEELKYSLIHDGPVAAGIKIYKSLSLDRNYVYKYNKCKNYSGHAVMIIGWTKDNWIIQNSWGKNWGDKGLFYIPIDNSFKEVFFEVYGITDNIVNLKVPEDKKVIQITYPIINFFMNLFKKE